MNRKELSATLQRIIEAFNRDDSDLHDDIQLHDEDLMRAIAMWFVGQERRKQAEKGE